MKKIFQFSFKTTPLYKQLVTFQKRAEKSQSISKGSIFVPVIIEGTPVSENFKTPFMPLALDSKLTIVQLIEYLRKVLKLPSNRALFIQIHHRILDHSYTVGNAYENFKDEDGFIYIFLKTEDTF